MATSSFTRNIKIKTKNGIEVIAKGLSGEYNQNQNIPNIDIEAELRKGEEIFSQYYTH